MDRKLAAKIIVFVILTAIGIYFFFHFDLHLLFTDKERLLKFIKDMGPWSVVAFIGLQALQVVFAPVPGEVTGFIGGYIYGIYWGTLYSTLGLTLGSWIAFILARIFGLPLVERFIKADLFQKYDRFITHQGKLVILALFLIPGFPKDALCYMLGLSHLKTFPFLIISVSGRLLGTIMLSASGDLLRNGLNSALLIPLLICLVIVGLAYRYREQLLAKVVQKRKHYPPGEKKENGSDGKYSS
ncbi:MAG TPA: TVP38/TMEM64 family protein [Syntrophales bacterium]|nr:TVP38/TMEM64 family protein [Syntrophales bacterium]HOL58428.1 TVP38/TMEM64 family protein [Syntrophales bacterium]HPO34597.1 TVP38/TMEM64 family protein [Syntrophales bacterium]